MLFPITKTLFIQKLNAEISCWSENTQIYFYFNKYSRNKISNKTFKLCLKEKSHIKDKNKFFELPYITCKEN